MTSGDVNPRSDSFHLERKSPPFFHSEYDIDHKLPSDFNYGDDTADSHVETENYTDEEYLAALIIQNHYRNFITEKRRKNIEESETNHNDDNIIQDDVSDSIDDDYSVRDSTNLNDHSVRNDAALKIQKHYKEYQQTQIRTTLADQEQNNAIPSNNIIAEEEQDAAARIIQNNYRKHFERRQSAAICIQNHCRKRSKANQPLESSPVEITVTEPSSEEEEQHENVERNNAAIKIQRFYRKNKEFPADEKSSEQINGLQCNSEEDFLRNEAAIKIQQAFRRNLEHRTDAASKIQRQYRKRYQYQTQAALKIQRHFRSHREEKCKEKAAITIQKQYRNHLNNVKMERAPRTVQANYRSYTEITHQNKAAMVIQKQFRKHRTEKREKAVTLIQHHYKHHLSAKETEVPAINQFHHDPVNNEEEENSPWVRRKGSVVHVTPRKRGSIMPPVKMEIFAEVLDNADIISKSPTKGMVSPAFEKEWPTSKRQLQEQSKSSTKSKIAVQSSLELKREQRKQEKNKLQDKFHLNNMNMRKSGGRELEPLNDNKREKGDMRGRGRRATKADISSVQQKNLSPVRAPDNKTGHQFASRRATMPAIIPEKQVSPRIGSHNETASEKQSPESEKDIEKSPFRNVLDQKRERRTSRQVKFDRSTRDDKETKRSRDKGRRATKADIAFGRKRISSVTGGSGKKLDVTKPRRSTMPVISPLKIESDSTEFDTELDSEVQEEQGISPTVQGAIEESCDQQRETTCQSGNPTDSGHTQKKERRKKELIKQGYSYVAASDEPELIPLQDSESEDTPVLDVMEVEYNAEMTEDDKFSPLPNNKNYQQSMLQKQRRNIAPRNRRRASEIPLSKQQHDNWRRSSEFNVKVTDHKHNGGTLDSYAVQNMLKKNQLLVRHLIFQKNDSHSYLHSYLKQTKAIERSPPVKRENKFKSKPDRGSIHRPSYSETYPGNLDKIARYGRNSSSEDWKAFVEPQGEGLKGISRGSFYNVLPSYGRMRSPDSDDAELTEIPWPKNIQ